MGRGIPTRSELMPDHTLTNPCLKEEKLSFKCLKDNNYEKKVCKDYFDNYNICRMFWDIVVSDRKKKDILPYLPDVADRDKVKEEYLKDKDVQTKIANKNKWLNLLR